MVQCENITTAAIINDQTGSSRKADFAITFNVEDSVVTDFARRGLETLSHSSYQPVCYSPPAVSLETKLEGERGHEAGLQICIWAYAHVMTLKQLLHKTGRPNTMIPALPLLVVHGGKWHFNYFEIGTDSSTRWAQVTIGDTATTQGVYQVIAAVQRLAE
ncbi:hypothetical protein B0A48_18765 [Cryoendolithus antarcticus]|uniref:PD-(D/E)XK nuclease-like domain-containing protein n=1 Tax=Cryoendolithus antarcticus TaxID=1507870 RepID=A0A1V8S8T7_9PEZI|nr:hypothetical protein B0A48_18765 [Cryoendolithus antarcticus]